MKYFNTPAGAEVAGNVFSQFVNSIVPVAASTGKGWGDMAILGSGIPFFHVGIGPIIAASIAMQVIVALVPSMKELTKDAVGQHTIQQYTRYLMFVVAIIQSFLTASELRQFYVEGLSPLGYYWTIVPVFVLGSCVLAWLSDEMTDSGLGNGSSVLITMSVCGAYWNAAKYYAPALLRRRWNRSSRSLVPDWRSSRAASWSRRERAKCRCCTSRARPSRACHAWFARMSITSLSR